MSLPDRVSKAAFPWPAGEILEPLPAAPSYSTVRTQLRVLETKGHVRHEELGLRYLLAGPQTDTVHQVLVDRDAAHVVEVGNDSDQQP